jgi:hypothetical protein
LRVELRVLYGDGAAEIEENGYALDSCRPYR